MQGCITGGLRIGPMHGPITNGPCIGPMHAAIIGTPDEFTKSPLCW